MVRHLIIVRIVDGIYKSEEMLLLTVIMILIFIAGFLMGKKNPAIKKDPPRLMCPYLKILTLIIIADSEGTSCKQI